MNKVWLIPLGAGGVGAMALLVCIRRLERTVSDLHRAMRPLRVRSREGSRAL